MVKKLIEEIESKTKKNEDVSAKKPTKKTAINTTGKAYNNDANQLMLNQVAEKTKESKKQQEK